ncbi:ABC transporter substrate-binding protein [Streptomyces albus subsp. chlorinus]|uniref:peptide ABC transporter substrate-binding protein n=1 Tax=Streptomyces albus TaxID=1888 RepID=UPI00156EA8E4|nr:ABC transporter substrate-binding protein [Streptomyces albus]NSC23689.1 ABC transporter substrate-binding protein [Streptomyces albus subsp. chlorinus]
MRAARSVRFRRAATTARWSALAVAVALTAAACGSGAGDGGKPAGYVSIDVTEPQKPLVPGNTNETQGAYVINALFTGLVEYNAKGKLENANAESITTDDSRTWTVKLRKGWTFHNGEDVTARSYVDAWNWFADIRNNQQNSFWFEDIKGYQDVHPEKGDPRAKAMSGLKVVDDHTFTIELTHPVSYFKYKLGYYTFAPLPHGFYQDPKKYGQHPVGNGPYTFEEWTHKKLIQVKAWKGYKGVHKAKNKGLQFRNYTSYEGAYQDVLSNTLDISPQVAPKDLPMRKNDFGDRSIDQPFAGTQTIAPAFYSKPFKDVDPKVLQGLSMAIDRKTITRTVLNRTRVPATGFMPPEVTGYQKLKTDIFDYDPKKARKLIKEGGGVPGNKLWIQFNADGGHKEWVTAVCDSIRKATGIECVGDSKPDFQTDLDARDAEQIKAFYRSGWVADYPLNVNFLKELYATQAQTNYGKFSDKEIDALFRKGDKATTLDGTIKVYQEAERKLAEKMPTIPLWDYKANVVHSKDVGNVKVNYKGDVILSDVTVK